MDEVTTSMDPVESYVSHMFYAPYLQLFLHLSVFQQYKWQESVAVATVKEKAQELHKTGTELGMCSCFYLQQPEIGKQVQEVSQSSWFLSLSLCRSDMVPESLGSFQGWVPHHVLHLEVIHKGSRLD